jgi:hypothetical protein
VGISFGGYLRVGSIWWDQHWFGNSAFVGIPVRKYLYVERDEVARRVSFHHLALLMRRYFELLPRLAIRGYQRALPSEIALLGAQDLVRVGLIDLVITGWPC